MPVLPIATEDTGLVIATVALAVATVLVAFPALWSALIEGRGFKRELLPVLVPARADGQTRLVLFGLDDCKEIEGAKTYSEAADGTVRFAPAVRNIGKGIAVLRGLAFVSGAQLGEPRPKTPSLDVRAVPSSQLYLGAGDVSHLALARTDPALSTSFFNALYEAVSTKAEFGLDLICSDHFGGQHTVARIKCGWHEGLGRYMCRTNHYWRLGYRERRRVEREVLRLAPTAGN